MFIGREKELRELTEQLRSERKTAILVYGKRRVGKSTLIKEAAKSFDGVVIDHFCPESTTYAGSVEFLGKSVCDTLGLPTIHFEHLKDVFEFLKTQNQNLLVILDEYQNMKNSGSKNEVDSYMQNVIDQLPPNIKVILCGSYVRIMKELLEKENPLFGRFSLTMHLNEFDYLDAARFYPGSGIQRKIANYAVFGGSPYVLENLNVNGSIEKNVVKLLLPDTGLLRTYIENIVLAEIQKAYDVRIFEIIGNGKKRYSDIQSSLGGANNGKLDKQLKELLGMELLEKVCPINKQKDNKKQFYVINDNLMRFYFTYVFGNSSQISRLGEEAFYKTYIAPTIEQFIARRFEGVVFQYFARRSRSGDLPGLLDYGSLWYDDPVKKTNGEFDCVLQYKEGYDFYECKYYRKPMKEAECQKEEEQIQGIPGVNCHAIGFVCSAGFDFSTGEYTLITGEDIYKEETP